MRLTDEQARVFLDETIRPAILGYFDFSEPVRLWAPGAFPLTWDGAQWTGCGALAHIGELEESSDGRALTTELELSPIPLTVPVDGVDIDILQIALAEQWHQRVARIYIGAFHATSLQWRMEPILWRKGFMDVMELTEAGTSARIRLTLERRDYDNERTDRQNYTAANQRDRYPGDAFCDQVASLQDKPITWNLA